MAPREHAKHDVRGGKPRSPFSLAERVEVATDDDVPRGTQVSRGEVEAVLTTPGNKAGRKSARSACATSRKTTE
jgi:hypothetical protein